MPRRPELKLSQYRRLEWQEILEEQDLYDMDARLTAMKAYEFREYIVGIKLAHYKGPDWTRSTNG